MPAATRRKTTRSRLAPVIPFPADARLAYVDAIAENMAHIAPKHAEDFLTDRVNLHRLAMHRKRVAPELIEQDCRRLEAAIRAALWRFIIVEGGCK